MSTTTPPPVISEGKQEVSSQDGLIRFTYSDDDEYSDYDSQPDQAPVDDIVHESYSVAGSEPIEIRQRLDAFEREHRKPSKVPTTTQLEQMRNPEPEEYTVNVPPPIEIPDRQEYMNLLLEQQLRDHAQEARKEFKRDTKAAAKGQKEMQKVMNMDPDVIKEKAILCTILNDYRDKYAHRFPHFKWHTHYDARMTYEQLQMEIDQVRMLINGSFSPLVFREGIKKVAEGGQWLSRMFGWGDATAKFPAQVEKSLEKGVYEDDIEQLMIDWRAYFQVAPQWRIALKLFNDFSTSLAESVVPFQRSPIYSDLAD